MATPDEEGLLKEFKLEKPAIGKGSYGKVYKALWTRQETQTDVAIKIFPLEVSQSAHAFEAEARMSVLLQSVPYCVTIKKAYVSNNKGYIVMSLLHGDLMDIKDSLKYKEKECAIIFQKICKAIQTLHRKRIVHLDIKPDNILIDNENTPFLADFGSSAVIPMGGRFNKPVGTVEFAAPEVFTGEAYSPFPSDVWSLGVLLYSILTSRYPKFKKGVYTPNAKLSESCNDFLASILRPKPQLRPNINRLVESEWFSVIDPETLAQDTLSPTKYIKSPRKKSKKSPRTPR